MSVRFMSVCHNSCNVVVHQSWKNSQNPMKRKLDFYTLMAQQHPIFPRASGYSQNRQRRCSYTHQIELLQQDEPTAFLIRSQGEYRTC